MSDLVVGAVCVFERRFTFSVEVDRRWERTVTKVTPKRAYFGRRDWVALDDPTREVKPRYLDYRTVVAEVRSPQPSDPGEQK